MGGPEQTEAEEKEQDPLVAERAELEMKGRGQLVEASMFDDVTATWDVDIHEQIDLAGKTMMATLHSNFNTFLQVRRYSVIKYTIKRSYIIILL